MHADHAGCAEDEWLSEPCRGRDGATVDRPIVWSRRNGPWRRVRVLWVGAAPGNAGGLGSGEGGAHGTRIPFGGDIAGANLDVMLGSIGLGRDDTFIVAALNQLPDSGGGEPTLAELSRPIGGFANSIQLLRDTIVASGAELVVALGNVALRATVGAGRGAGDAVSAANGRSGRSAGAGAGGSGRVRLPTLRRLKKEGVVRGELTDWPAEEAPSEAFVSRWRSAWGDAPLPRVLWLLHPSAQNMSPYAGSDTVFHRRMTGTVAALRRAATEIAGIDPPARRPPRPGTRASPSASRSIYQLPEWRELVEPRHRELDELWRTKGV